MAKPSLRQRAEEQRSRDDRSFRVGSIAMLPAGLILLIASVVQLSKGDYTIGQNFYGAPVGPGLRAIIGFVFSCLGAISAWLYFRDRRKPPSKDNDEAPS